MADDKTEYTDREINISNAFFDIMQPRMIYFFKQFLEARQLETEIFWKEQMVPNISKDVREKIMSDVEDMIDSKLDDIKKSLEFDMNDYSSEIKDIVEEILRYDLTFTTTVD
jgi:hypothetical protein